MPTHRTTRPTWWPRARRRTNTPAPPVRLRPMYPADPAVSAVFDGLSATSRRLRFHAPAPRLTSAMVRQLHAVDGRRRAGIVAEVRTPTGFVPAGVARLADTGLGRADLAVEVVDRWQGRGIGLRLLTALGDLAREHGYHELHADVLVDNPAARQLLRRAFPGSRELPDGEAIRVSCPLEWSATPLGDDDLLADLALR